jgi:predicted outer membrane protein
LSSFSVAEFAQQMAAAHEQFAKEVQTVIGSFRRKNNEFKFER